MKIKIGADPEVFAYDKRTGKPVSVHDIIPGNKLEPAKVPRGAIQVDGVAAEFNIHPASSRAEFVRNIKKVYEFLGKVVLEKDPNLELKATPCALFDQDYFDKLPFECLQLGCEPDFDAYTLMMKNKPKTDKPLRTGAGHIHIGFNETIKPKKDLLDIDYMKKCASLVYELDWAFGPVQTYWDSDEERRTLYGEPGTFRPKPYGLEYRVLSNAWLKETWSIMYVHDLTKGITQLWSHGFSPKKSWDELKKKPNSLKGFCDYLQKIKLPSLENYIEGVLER